MLNYCQNNVNPKGRRTGDCSTRALVGTLGISYEQALQLQLKWSLKTFYDPTSKQVMEKVLSEFGYVKMKQPKKADGTKYTVGELDKIIPKYRRDNGVLVTIANHHTCIIGDCVQDIWDCRCKSIGNYYIKLQ